MSSSLRRLMKEATELSTHRTPDLHAAPTDDTNLYDWHFTISGPPCPSPYSSGIYHGRITFPATYPLRPPSFRFLTPSGRFEVNREICLSISGHHEESWQPAWGVRTALVAIRSFMDGDARGQVGGLDVEEGVRRDLARESREWVCPVCKRSNLSILGEQAGIEHEVQGEAEGERAEDGKQGETQSQRQGQPEQPEGQQETEKQPEKLPGEQPAAIQGERQTDIQPGHRETETQTRRRERDPEAVQPDLQRETQPTRVQDTQPERQPGHPETETQTWRRIHTEPERGPEAVVQAQTQPTRVQHAPVQQRQRQPEDWLDKAILAVLIALVIMIARRILNAQLDDYL